jgi:hypothetical protein
MIKCEINKIWLLIILLFIWPYVWLIGHIVEKGIKPDTGAMVFLTILVSVPIYALLFQVKTIRVSDKVVTIFYRFRLWTKNYSWGDLEKWNYRKTTKTLRFEFYWKSKYVTLKFKNNSGRTILFSLALTNFDSLLKYLNEGYKELRTNKKFM